MKWLINIIIQLITFIHQWFYSINTEIQGTVEYYLNRFACNYYFMVDRNRKKGVNDEGGMKCNDGLTCDLFRNWFPCTLQICVQYKEIAEYSKWN